MDEFKGFAPAMREHFKKLGKTDDEIAALESGLANKGQAAKDAGLESKEAEPATPPADAPAYATQGEVAQMFAEVTQVLANVVSQLNTMTAEVKALKASDEEKIAKAAAATPRASLAELVNQMAIGQPAAAIDGRTTLAKAGPKQAAAEADTQVTPSPLLNRFMSQARGGV